VGTLHELLEVGGRDGNLELGGVLLRGGGGGAVSTMSSPFTMLVALAADGASRASARDAK
jgi:hypothetical protein